MPRKTRTRQRIAATTAILALGGGLSLIAAAPAAGRPVYPPITGAPHGDGFKGTIIINKVLDPIVGQTNSNYIYAKDAGFKICKVVGWQISEDERIQFGGDELGRSADITQWEWWYRAAEIVAQFNAHDADPSGLLLDGSFTCVTQDTYPYPDPLGTSAGHYYYPNLPLGLYLVTETDIPAGVEEALVPFLVTLPFQYPGGGDYWPSTTGLGYTVSITPKNFRNPPASKSADLSDLTQGKNVIHYTVLTQMPGRGESLLEEFSLVDTVGEGLKFVTNTTGTAASPLTITVTPKTGVDPTTGNDTYGPPQVASTAYFDNTVVGNKLTVKATPAGLAWLSNGNVFRVGTKVEFKYDAIVEDSVAAAGGGMVHNDALITWKPGKDLPPTEVDTYLGGIKLHKTEGYTNVPITVPGTPNVRGARFRLFDNQAAAQATNGTTYFNDNETGSVKILQPALGGSPAVVKNVWETITSGEGLGTVSITGLPYDPVGPRPDDPRGCSVGEGESVRFGTKYWVVEISAPTGYMQDPRPHEVCVVGPLDNDEAGDSYDDWNIPNLPRNIGIELPFTGKAGDSLPVIFGLVLVMGAFTFYVVWTKRAKARTMA